MAELLNHDAIQQRLGELDGWTAEGNKLAKRFQFKDFVTAFGWMSSAALVAEKMNHHPDWKNVYRTVDVELTTHDAGGITENDLKLAAAMDRLAAGKAR